MRIVSRLVSLSLGLAMTTLAPIANAEPAKEFDAAAYAAVLAKAHAGDPSTDYDVLRKQSLYQAHYRLDTLTLTNNLQSGFKMLDTDSAQALHIAEDALKANYSDLFAHVLADQALSKLGRPDESQKHHTAVMGLLLSITDHRKGLNQADAFNAISVAEEYQTLSLLGLKPAGKQSLIHSGEHSFDTLDVIVPESGKQLTIWFNIDAYFGHELGL